MPIGPYNNWTPSNNWSGTWPWNQPYQPQSNTLNNQQSMHNQQPINNILRVTGPESAKAYPLPEKSSVVLFDAENPIFYLKTTDDGGFPNPLRAFNFEEIKSEEIQTVAEPIDTSNFATKEDLQMLQADFSEIKEMLEGLMN